jgi:hypothetical protein
MTKKQQAEALLEEKDILNQAKTEFRLAKDALTPKWLQWQTNLKLYNNQKRDKEAVGNNLLYTLFNTLLSFLYFDKLTVSFEPRESGDVERCQLVTQLAQYDFEEMGMSRKKYDILWDSLFFGNAYVYVGGLQDQTPVVEVIDPFTIYIDPIATSIQDTRFIALERQMTKWEMKQKGFKNIEQLTEPNLNTQTRQAEQARKEAKNEVSQNEPQDYENKKYIVLEWFTIRGSKKVHFYTDFNCSILLSEVKPLVFKDNLFPFVVYPFSPVSHELSSISVPDLLEDKQRASAILLNLGLAMEKAKLYPRYLFDRNAILNIQDLKNIQFNKYIPVDAAGRSIRDIIAPLEQSSITNSTDAIYSLIRDIAERTVGTPALKQGIVSTGKRTATELQLAAINADTRNSLAAKIYALSDIEFWKLWLNRYKQFKTLAKGKIVRIQGALGARFESIEADTFDFHTDPDIRIESSNIAAQKKMLEIQQLVEMSQILITDSTPEFSKRYFQRKLLQLSDFRKDEIDQIVPPTFDELRAQEENKLLEKGKLPEIEPYDDHYTHIMVHNSVPSNETTRNVLIAHIQAHKTAYLDEKREEKEQMYQAEKKMKSNLLNQVSTPNKGELEKFTAGQIPTQPIQSPLSNISSPQQFLSNIQGGNITNENPTNPIE